MRCPTERHADHVTRGIRAARLAAALGAAILGLGAAADTPPLQVPGPGPAAAPEREALLAERELAQGQFLRLMDEKRFAEAEAIAAQVVKLTQRIFGENDIALASPLKNLATAELGKGDVDAAARNYLACIDVVERREGILSVRLVDPLLGLAKAHLNVGRYEEARLAYERALQINHAGQGFYNPEQLLIRDGLSEAFLGLEKPEEANFQQEAQVAIQRHRTGESSVDMVPAQIKLARWYQRVGLPELANLSYQRAAEILGKAGAKDPAMIDILVGRSDAYRSQGQVGVGLSYLKRALDIVDLQPNPDRARRAALLVEIGDTYMLAARPGSALARYAEAWGVLSEDPALAARRDELLAQPVLLAGPVPNSLTRAARAISPRERAGALADGVVVTRLTVDDQGRPHDIVVEESSPRGLLDDQVVSSLRASVFRPRFVDGQAVTSANTRYRHQFKYARSEVSGNGAGAVADKSGQRIDLPPAPAQAETKK
jgi:TonB family protein